MSNKRKLDETEKRFAKQNLEILKTELEYIEKVELPRIQFTIDTADLVIKKQLADKTQEKAKLEHDINSIKKTIEILEDQIKNGVNIKQKGGVEDEWIWFN